MRSTLVRTFRPSAGLPCTVTVRPSSVRTVAVRPSSPTWVTVPVKR
jgi:hypothetical protein